MPTEEIGFRLSVDEGNSKKSVSEFKEELKTANSEAEALVSKFGAFSPQALKATANVNKLTAEFKNLNGAVDQLPEEVNVNLNVNDKGAKEILNGLDSIQAKEIEVTVNTSGAVEAVDNLKNNLQVEDAALNISVNTDQAISAVDALKNDLQLTDPVINVSANTEDAISNIDNLKSALVSDDTNIKVNVETEEALQAVEEIKTALVTEDTTLKVNVDTAGAIGSVDQLKESLQADDTNLKVNVDTANALGSVNELKDALVTEDVSIKADVDTTNALEAVEELKSNLQTEDTEINISVNAEAATGSINEFKKELNTGDVNVKVNVDTNKAETVVDNFKAEVEDVEVKLIPEVQPEPIIKTVKSFKQELKEAKQEAFEAARAFGEFSPEAIAAAAKVGKLKDEFQDLNSLADNLTDEKRFASFAGLAGSLSGGFTAATGAMGLMNGKSKELEETLVKVQSAMALSQGLGAVADLGRKWSEAKAALMSFTVVQKANELATKAAATVQRLFTGAVDTTTGGFGKLKAAIIGTGIGALAIAIGFVVTHFEKLKEMIFNLIPGLSSVADFIGGIVDAVTDFAGVTSDATREADRLSEGIKTQNEAHEQSIQLLEASGATAKQVREAKNAMYEDELNSLRQILKLRGSLSEDESKEFKDLKFKQALLKAEQAKADKDEADATAKKTEEEHKKAVEAAEAKSKKLSEAAKKAREEERKQEVERDNEIQKRYEEETAAAIKALEDKHKFELELLTIQGGDKVALRQQQIDEEIQLLKDSGGKFAEGITELEQEKVLVAAQAKADAEAAQKEIDEQNAEDAAAEAEAQKEVELELRKENEENELLAVQEKYDAMREVVKGNEKLLTEVTAAEAEARAAVEKKFDDLRLQQKRENLAQLGGMLAQGSALFGKHTVAGKAFAIADATVQTYLGATKAISASSSIPIIGTALGIANAALIVASGIKSIATIVKTKVPNTSGDAGGGATPPSMPAQGNSPATSNAPTMDGIQSTLLDTTKSLQDKEKEPLKAYVVESEITQKQERAQAITQTANF